MILYTLIPLEQVFTGSESSMPEMTTMQYKSRTVMGYRQEDGRYQLARIITTDPQDYLNPKLQPGQYISHE